ncbi:MAG: hypothetical protein J1E35_05550, partial [Lachnospiraceae bacterium]|nr:hypothetical protein [Lachnospiraceae bacterium]
FTPFVRDGSAFTPFVRDGQVLEKTSFFLKLALLARLRKEASGFSANLFTGTRKLLSSSSLCLHAHYTTYYIK